MSKNRTELTGSLEDNWETPDCIKELIVKEFGEYYDPCPLAKKDSKEKYIIEKDGLKTDWGKINYINPPYNRFDKPKFIQKAYEESMKGKICVMLIPASVESKQFHEVIVPNAEVRLIKGRIKFKGYNTKGEYVTNKCGQSGSMLVIFGTNKRGITAVDLKLCYCRKCE